jgi:hypothetical protein
MASYIEFAETTSSPAYQTAQILEKLGCSEGDVKENQDGRLSKRQIEKLFMSEVAVGVGGTVLLMIACLVVAAAQYAWVPAYAPTPVSLRICRLAAILGLMLSILRLPRKLIMDLFEGKVASTTGRPKHNVKEEKIKIDAGKELMKFHSFQVNGVEIPIKTYVLEAFNEVERYTFYYTPRSHELVAAVRSVEDA